MNLGFFSITLPKCIPETHFIMNNEPVQKKEDDHFKEPEYPKGEYMGNIWGWKNSMIGAVIIFAFLILVVVRYCQVKPDSFYVRESMHMEKVDDK